MPGADNIARFHSLVVGLEERVPGAVGITVEKMPQDYLGLLSLKRVAYRSTETVFQLPRSRR